jgi:hypothetical protein
VNNLVSTLYCFKGLVRFNLVWRTGYDVRGAFYLGQEKVWFGLIWFGVPGYDVRSAFYPGQEKVWFGLIWFGQPVMTSGVHSTWARRRFGLV